MVILVLIAINGYFALRFAIISARARLQQRAEKGIPGQKRPSSLPKNRPVPLDHRIRDPFGQDLYGIRGATLATALSPFIAEIPPLPHTPAVSIVSSSSDHLPDAGLW